MTESSLQTEPTLAALLRIFDRPQPAVPWRDGANLPWDDPAFSRRMLAQHLDQTTARPAAACPKSGRRFSG